MSSDKIIIVGGSGSIGASIAKEVIDDGLEPHLVGRNFYTLKETAEKIKCSYSVADVTNTDEFTKILKKIEGNICGVAYCVGSINLKSLSLAYENDYIDSFKVNTLGAVIAVKALKEKLIKNNGSVLLFSSIAAKQGFTNHTIVSTSKGGIEGLTVSLAAELSPNVKVNCIAPSLTESRMSESFLSNETLKKNIESLHPIPKIGSPEDHSKLASYLLGKNNHWITGQIFNIDGGRSSVRKKG